MFMFNNTKCCDSVGDMRVSIYLQGAVNARRPLVYTKLNDDRTLDAMKPLGDSILSNEAFDKLVASSAQCANKPVSGLTYRPVPKSDAYVLDSGVIEGIWNSKKSRNVNDITLCTQFDRTRSHMLEGQCKAFGGPISAAVYVPKIYFEPEENERAVESMKSELSALHSRIEKTGACILDIVLISELHMADEAWEYPYNSNRNHAIARARTRVVVLLDVDFIPNNGFRQSMLEPKKWAALVKATHINNQVLVLPAFETKQSLSLQEGLDTALRAAEGSKDDIFNMFHDEEITRFAPFFQHGHGATNYTRWFSASRGYRVKPDVGYEPFIMMSRMHVPWFDERFRGYGWDKIVHIQHIAKSGYKLVVHPDAWVVHRPHKPSQGYFKSFTGPVYAKGHKPTEELKKLDVVAKEMLELLKKGQYPRLGLTSLVGCHPAELLAKKKAAASVP